MVLPMQRTPPMGYPTARPAAPIIPPAVRLNPDGSAAPATGLGSTGTTGQPIGTSPITGAARDLGLSGVGLTAGLASPSTLLERQFTTGGQDPYGGLLDSIIQALPPDQLNQLLDIVNASSGNVATDESSRANQILGLSTALQGQNQLPSLAQLFGGLFQGGAAAANTPGNPFYGLMAGGTSAQQADALLSAVLNMAQMTGISGGQENALAASLNALARNYMSSQMGVGANGTFIDYLQRKAPTIVGALGG